MEFKNLQKKYKSQEIKISKTLYRCVFVLKLLSDKPYSIPEIQKELSENSKIKTIVSVDTIRGTLNTLKAFGCKISKIKEQNIVRYKVDENIFKIFLSQNSIDFLNALRNDIASYISWNTLFEINQLYDIINDNFLDKDKKDFLSTQYIFKNVNKTILNQLLSLCEAKNLITILYESKNEIKPYKIYPYFISYDNSKLYLWCFNTKYNDISYLRIDKVKKIIDIDLSQKQKEIIYKKAILEFKNDAVYTFLPDEHTKIIEENENYLKIEYSYINEFHFM